MSNFTEIVIELKNEYVETYENWIRENHKEYFDYFDQVIQGPETRIYRCYEWNHYNDQFIEPMIDELIPYDTYKQITFDEYHCGYIDGDLEDSTIYLDIVTPSDEEWTEVKFKL